MDIVSDPGEGSEVQLCAGEVPLTLPTLRTGSGGGGVLPHPMPPPFSLFLHGTGKRQHEINCVRGGLLSAHPLTSSILVQHSDCVNSVHAALDTITTEVEGCSSLSSLLLCIMNEGLAFPKPTVKYSPK